MNEDQNQQSNTDTNGTTANTDLENRVKELEHNWKRALADYQNLEKRMVEEKISYASFANSTLILKLLPIVDNLEMLDKHLNDTGLKLILKELKQVLLDENVTEVDPINNDFDANSMEAIEMIEGEEGKVLEVLTKGYKLKNKLLRPARVKVGKSSS